MALRKASMALAAAFRSKGIAVAAYLKCGKGRVPRRTLVMLHTLVGLRPALPESRITRFVLVSAEGTSIALPRIVRDMRLRSSLLALCLFAAVPTRADAQELASLPKAHPFLRLVE